MKKTIKYLTLIILCLSFILSSCSSKNDVDNIDKIEAYGTHIYTYKETSQYLVKDGKSEYSILLPSEPDKFLLAASEEFKTFYLQATGVKIPVVIENSEGVRHNNKNKYISIGDTKLLESADLKIDKAALTDEGVRIITLDNTIYLIGGSSQGALYSVYVFMQLMFDFEIYYTDTWKINENQQSVKLMNFNVTDIPDIPTRFGSFGPVKDNLNNLAYRFRMPHYYGDYIIPAGDLEKGTRTATIHNTADILPEGPEEWFNAAGDQLCYTAHGDKTKYAQMVDQIVKVLIKNIEQYPVKLFPLFNTITITIEDTMGSCNCDACVEAKNLYGADSGAIIVLCNDVMEKIDYWMQNQASKEYYRDDFRLLFFAYNTYLDAPSHYDAEQNKYVVNHPDLVMRDDVGVFFALSHDMQYAYSVYHPQNKKALENCQKWFDISSYVYLWTYSVNYHEYLTMCDTFNHFNTQGYQFYTSGSVDKWLNQGASQNKDTTNFNGLKAFLDYKLMWNSSLNSDELIDEWFDAMYGEAAPLMYKLFNEQRAWFFSAYEKAGALDFYKMSVYLKKPEYWPINMLRSWINTCSEAQEQIKKIYETYQPELYKKYKKHIDQEWISPAYLLLSRHEKSNIPTEEFNQIVNYFDVILKDMGSLRVGEVAGGLDVFLSTIK